MTLCSWEAVSGHVAKVHLFLGFQVYQVYQHEGVVHVYSVENELLYDYTIGKVCCNGHQFAHRKFF